MGAEAAGVVAHGLNFWEGSEALGPQGHETGCRQLQRGMQFLVLQRFFNALIKSHI
jgi:hypothetical protein